MKTLYLDTCAGALGIGITGGKIDVCLEEEVGKKTAESLFPTLLKALKMSGLSLADIERTTVTRGPGSYTGERLGLTVAKILATVNPRMELCTASTLLALAPAEGLAAVMIDARNGACFAGYYRDRKLLAPEARIDISSLRSFVTEQRAELIISSTDRAAKNTLSEFRYRERSIISGLMELPYVYLDIESDPLKAAPVYMHGQAR